MRHLQTLKTLTILAVVSILFAACSSSSAPPAPLSAFQPEIVNGQDAFSFQATATENVSAVVSYDWLNSGTQATINHSSAVDSGSVSVVILDNSGAQVYGNPLVASLNEPTSAGVAGTWTVTITLVNVYGTLNFSADML